jgi:hypothetical protein
MNKENIATEIKHFWAVASDNYAMFGDLRYHELMQELGRRDEHAHKAVLEAVDFILGDRSLHTKGIPQKVLEVGPRASMLMLDMMIHQHYITNA